MLGQVFKLPRYYGGSLYLRHVRMARHLRRRERRDWMCDDSWVLIEHA
jgi:hypothetical protein